MVVQSIGCTLSRFKSLHNQTCIPHRSSSSKARLWRQQHKQRHRICVQQFSKHLNDCMVFYPTFKSLLLDMHYNFVPEEATINKSEFKQWLNFLILKTIKGMSMKQITIPPLLVLSPHPSRLLYRVFCQCFTKSCWYWSFSFLTIL